MACSLICMYDWLFDISQEMMLVGAAYMQHPYYSKAEKTRLMA